MSEEKRTTESSGRPRFQEPILGYPAFNCPNCGAFAEQHQSSITYVARNETEYLIDGWSVTYCYACEQPAFWHEDSLIWPYHSTFPLPNSDMSELARKDFNEARIVATQSPRAGAALLRLAIQRICKDLGATKPNINDAIAELVKQGLDVRVSKMLDVVRVTGNHAVHPGEMSDADNLAHVSTLFDLTNRIVDELVTKPRELEEIFERLPEKDRRNIDMRNNKAQQKA